jgi:hypothetical protein
MPDGLMIQIMKLWIGLIWKRSRPTMMEWCSKQVPVPSQIQTLSLQFSCTVVPYRINSTVPGTQGTGTKLTGTLLALKLRCLSTTPSPPPPHFIINLSHQNWTCVLILKILSKMFCRPQLKTYFKS